jgi:CRISPR system Cascade subunit CasB
MSTTATAAVKMTARDRSIPEFLALREVYEKSDNGTQAVIRRVASIGQLLEEPAFYRLVGSLGYDRTHREQWARVVFCLCLPKVHHLAGGPSLGAALSVDGRIKDRRLFQVLRSEWPQDMTQLRRLILFVEPVLDWGKAAKTLWYWGERSRRELLEDFILYQSGTDTDKKINN